MRKYIIIPVILLCLASAGLLWAFADINGQKDDITVKETIEAGKAEATKGLKVTTNILDDEYHLYWATDMFPRGNQEAVCKTQFTYDKNHEVELHDPAEDRYMAIEDFGYRTSYVNTDRWESGEKERLGTRMAIAQAAFDAAGDKETFVWNCNLDAYMDYLPVDLYIECFVYDHNMLNTQSDGDGGTIDWTNYFQIPVPANFAYQVKVRKNDSGDLTAITTRVPDTEESAFSLNSDGFLGEEGLFLAVSTIEEIGSGEIIAECPTEKRGIHFIPTVERSHLILDFEKAKMVYPIPSGHKVINLNQSPDGKTLYLLTKHEDGLTVDIIDKETYTCRQKVKLSKSFEHSVSFEVCRTDNDWVFYSFNRGEFVLVAEEKGVYKEVLEDTVGTLALEGDLDCDYDGRRLAIVAIDRDLQLVETKLLIFDKHGCLYRGRFDYNITRSLLSENESSYYYDKRVYVEFTDEI